MKKIRFAMIGGGWRAAFYVRIARAMPESFEISAVLIRTAEKRTEWEAAYGIPAVGSLEELLASGPDFLLLSITKASIANYLCRLMEIGVPILCETPPAICLEDLQKVWDAARTTGANVQIAEQYIRQPFYACWLTAVRENMLGPVSNLSISSVHSYHAVSILRSFLGVGFSNAKIIGNRHCFPVCKTDSRQGMVRNGMVADTRRDRLEFVFEGGKTAFFDFSPEQYESFIRTRHFSVQGERGEIDDLQIRYLNSQGDPVQGRQRRLDLGVYNNRDWSHFGIELNGRFLYKNPYPQARLNDDEIAIADCLTQMALCVRAPEHTVYPLSEALQDAYFALMMEQALSNPYQTLFTQTQAWGT